MSETDIRKGSNNMAKKDIDWANLGFGYIKTDYRYVSNYKTEHGMRGPSLPIPKFS